MKTISVPLGDRSYSIHVGSGILQKLGWIVGEIVPASKYFFVLDENIESSHGQVAMNSFSEDTDACSLQAVESNKTIDSIQDIWSAMLSYGCDRTVPLVSVGGGLVGDVGGFAAATFMRGVPVIQVPTTLLAMVDASIGGKTGVNLPIERTGGQVVLGKNLAGSFWQPALVVADVDTLNTLDDRQLRCGLAECVKHAMLGHEKLLTWIEQHLVEIFARDTDALVELVSECASIKAEVVAQDERESGCRALLNLGHTFAHAIEPLRELSLYHGEAVSIGLCASVFCAEAAGLVDAEYVDRIRGVLTNIGLPIRLPASVHIEELVSIMQRDKKTVDALIRLVLPTEEGATIVDEIDDGAIGLAWASVGASA
jgi:3-dehydroquinate synthase